MIPLDTRRAACLPRVAAPATARHREFAVLLDQYRRRSDLSRNELARAVQCDPSYISRLLRCEREPPRLPLIRALAEALHLSRPEQDRLLTSAGYASATVALLGTWDETLQAVAEVLVDPRVTPEAQTEFRTVVQALARRWRTP